MPLQVQRHLLFALTTCIVIIVPCCANGNVCVTAVCPFMQPGKLVAENDARADVLQQLEAAFKAAPAQGGDSKGAKKAAAK